MTIRFKFSILSFLTTALTAVASPNIIIITADDVGYCDIGCEGATLMAAPGIDRLANNSIRFPPASAATAFRGRIGKFHTDEIRQPGANTSSVVIKPKE